MFVSITTTDTSGSPPEEGPIVGEEMDAWLQGLDGYRGLVLLARPGVTLGLAFWETRGAAERHDSVRAEFRERMLGIAGAQIESVEGYDVAFSRVDAI
jgi:hypothetical protein